MATYKVAYGKKENIRPAIDKGIIPPGSLILTENSNEIFFYSLDKDLVTYEERYKFGSIEEAQDWVDTYDCKGRILSIHDKDVCKVCVVGYDNKITPIESASEEQIAELVETYLKNKSLGLVLVDVNGNKQIHQDGKDVTEEVKSLLSSGDPGGGQPGVLPDVSSEDDGKVLMVSNGKWVAKELPKYNGEYTITPDTHNDITLLTSQKMLDGNIKLTKIPYHEVTNNSGGTTVTIGED